MDNQFLVRNKNTLVGRGDYIFSSSGKIYKNENDKQIEVATFVNEQGILCFTFVGNIILSQDEYFRQHMRQMMSNNYESRELEVAKMIYVTFLGEMYHEIEIGHKDNDIYNCNLENLYIKKRVIE